MGNSYKLRLKVCDTKGKVIVATVTRINANLVQFNLPFIQEVANDKKINTPSGVLALTYPVKMHKEIVAAQTKYLESLFLKELGNEDNNTSNNNGDKPTGSKKPVDSSTVGKGKGKEPSSLHSSRRGSEQTDSGRGRESKSDMAQGGDKKGS